MLATDQARLVDRAYRDSLTTPVNEIAEALQQLLSRRLTAYVAGVKDSKTVARWATGQISDIREASEVRLRTAYEIVRLLTLFDSPAVVKAWFIGLNPQLEDISPAEALHDGKLREVRAAARAFVVGG
jgi:hypothetical protein